MKVVCDRAALVEALALAGSVVPSRTTAPVLGCLSLRTIDGVLNVSATNAEVGLSIGVPQVEVQEEGEALVPADKLNQIVRACEDTTLTLNKERSVFHVQGEDAHFKIFGFDPTVQDRRKATVDGIDAVLSLWQDPPPGAYESGPWRFSVPQPNQRIGLRLHLKPIKNHTHRLRWLGVLLSRIPSSWPDSGVGFR